MEEPWQIEDTGQFLYMRVTGAYGGVPFADNAINLIAERCKAARRWRVLIDLTPMQGAVSNFDRFMLGQQAAKMWGRRIKVAVITNAETVNRFFENVAVNNGGNVRMFTDREEAVDWLTAKRLT